MKKRSLLGMTESHDDPHFRQFDHRIHFDLNIEYAARLQSTYNSLYPSGKIRISIKDITVKNPVTQIGPAAGLITEGVGDILGKLASTNTWIRVLLVIIGAIALIGAVGIFVRELR